MAKMNNELFHYLTSRDIFKGWHPSSKASEKTEQRRAERNRYRLVWLAKGQKKDSVTGLSLQVGKGTYIKKLHGNLRFSRHAYNSV
jgi:hypothetical protein